MEVHNIQEVVTIIFPKKKKCKKTKWLLEEVLEIAEKRREAEGKGEMEIYTHLNSEFQRRARSGKKAFLSEQCKEIEETIELETRNLFSKIRDNQENPSCKDGHKKYRNSMGLTEAKDIKKRW